MDYAKLDPSLSVAVDTGGEEPEARNLLVTVVLELAPTEAQREVLRGTGVEFGPEDRTVASGMISRRGVEELSHAPWVRSLTLSSTRRPL
ncbi:hypothetical protein ACWENA_22175 [Streptomyces sp. NPDC004779]